MASTTYSRRQRRRIIFILGWMTALSPFSIDMYLPAFAQIAGDYATSVARVSLSLSSFFVGMAGGQLIYGPLLDRFGRRPPLFVGLFIYFGACFGCALAPSTTALVVWRFFQALGGCVTGVTAMAVVRDLFDRKESARVIALLILILGTSPLFAPTIGGYLAVAFGWRLLFLVLAGFSVVLFTAIYFGLPETHAPDPRVTLRPGPIARSLLVIVRDPRFFTYVFSGGLAFSGLYLYLAGAPIIFINHYGMSARAFGWIFAIIAAGMIGASQLNALLLRRFSSERLLHATLSAQVVVAVVFVVGIAAGWFGLYSTIGMFFLVVACLGLSNPNSAALALAPFGANAGRAAALMGFFQIGLGSLVSTLVAVLGLTNVLPVVILLAVTSATALALLIGGTRSILALAALTDADPQVKSHA